MLLHCTDCEKEFARGTDLMRHRIQKHSPVSQLIKPDFFTRKRKSIFDGIDFKKKTYFDLRLEDGVVGKTSWERTYHDKNPLQVKEDTTFRPAACTPFLLKFTCKHCPANFTKLGQFRVHTATHEDISEDSESDDDGDVDDSKNSAIIKPITASSASGQGSRSSGLSFWKSCCSSSLFTHPEFKNIFSSKLHEKLMNKVPIHYSSFPGYTKYEVRTPSVRPRSRLRLSDEDFFVGELRGEGGFAKVYSATWENGEEPDCVLKVQRPSNDWEWYILTQLGERLKQTGNLELRDNYMMANRCYTYTDGSIIVSRLQPQGSLLNLINTVHTKDKSVSESLALHLTVQILDLIHTLHTLDFIHADLKPDNFLVRDLPDFNNNSIQLIDFGKAIDLRTIPANIVFEDLVSTSGLKCVEMREKRPWRHHIDYFGVAATSYCLLFGQYMKVTKRDGRWQPKGTYKRGWQVQFWRKFFDTLLNLEGAEQKCLPSLQRLAASCREVLHRDVDLSQGVSKARELLQRNLTKRRRTI